MSQVTNEQIFELLLDLNSRIKSVEKEISRMKSQSALYPAEDTTEPMDAVAAMKERLKERRERHYGNDFGRER